MTILRVMPREDIVRYLKDLRDRIVSRFEAFEAAHSDLSPPARIERTTWPYTKGEGGGEMSVLRGRVFEKAAVNWSGVSGDKFPMGDATGAFFATGVSLITHMRNPKVPTVHFNIRYIQAGDKSWLGGGFDLTPMGFPFDEDTKHFHAVARETLEPFGADLYPKFSAAAKEYFTIPHYGVERGVGGIFFDHYRSDNWDRDLGMWKNVGDRFLDAVMPIYERRIGESFSDADRAKQIQARGRYVEFNLLYDRGTKFGFQSGGNPAAILCSMPPLAGW